MLRASVVSVVSVRREDAHDRRQGLRKQITEPPLLRRTDLGRAETHAVHVTPEGHLAGPLTETRRSLLRGPGRDQPPGIQTRHT